MEDLGDRYLNPLSYLTTNNPENLTELDSPMLTDPSEPESSSMAAELASMLETLFNIINLENRYRNTSELCLPPADFKDADLAYKISFIQELTQALQVFIQTGKFSPPQFISPRIHGEILTLPPPRVRKDVITKLVNCTDGVFLSQNDLKQLSALLVGGLRDVQKESVREMANVNKERVEKKKNEYREMSDELDRLNTSQEVMISENMELRNKVKMYKQQIRNLEKQLEETKKECEETNSHCISLRENLSLQRKKIQEQISKDTEGINLRISVSKLSIPAKFSIGMPHN
jgi:hypothetical protein